MGIDLGQATEWELGSVVYSLASPMHDGNGMIPRVYSHLTMTLGRVRRTAILSHIQSVDPSSRWQPQSQATIKGRLALSPPPSLFFCLLSLPPHFCVCAPNPTYPSSKPVVRCVKRRQRWCSPRVQETGLQPLLTFLSELLPLKALLGFPLEWAC
jgi:hypothetical protein